MHGHFFTFNEWLTTDEAKHRARSFEHTVLVPMPKRKVEISLRLFNNKGEVAARHDFISTRLTFWSAGLPFPMPAGVTFIKEATAKTALTWW